MCFFNDTATTEIYTLSLHDALPISRVHPQDLLAAGAVGRLHEHAPVEAAGTQQRGVEHVGPVRRAEHDNPGRRSEEHTSELQSRQYLVCRLLLEKKN